jgi:hypothetical protein
MRRQQLAFYVPDTDRPSHFATRRIDGGIDMRMSRALYAFTVAVFAVVVTGCSCRYDVASAQPIVFDSNGGAGSFTINAKSGCKWNADEDNQAEDWVKVASGTMDGTGTMKFTVMSAAQQPNVPLPRAGYINVYDDGGKVVTKVRIEQK